jgi:hypothetical protein
MSRTHGTGAASRPARAGMELIVEGLVDGDEYTHDAVRQTLLCYLQLS